MRYLVTVEIHSDTEDPLYVYKRTREMDLDGSREALHAVMAQAREEYEATYPHRQGRDRAMRVPPTKVTVREIAEQGCPAGAEQQTGRHNESVSVKQSQATQGEETGMNEPELNVPLSAHLRAYLKWCVAESQDRDTVASLHSNIFACEREFENKAADDTLIVCDHYITHDSYGWSIVAAYSAGELLWACDFGGDGAGCFFSAPSEPRVWARR